jgi:hypothetical protein
VPRSIGLEEIRKRFGRHEATTEETKFEGGVATAPVHESLEEAFIAFGDYLDEKLPHERNKSLALQHLEMAAMWANKSVATQAPLKRKR